MKLGTQPVNALGHAAFASGTPVVLPTNTNSPFAKLIVKSDLGHIVQQWLLLQTKCTLGSASSCALRCQLPGIAPYHALLVMGARQVFIRALSPKLTRNGVTVNELLLTEDECTFEIAGHMFELIRSVKANEPAQSDKATRNKMKFALARPMEIGQTRQPIAIPAPAPVQTPAPIPKQLCELPLPPKQRQSFDEPQVFKESRSFVEPQAVTKPQAALEPQALKQPQSVVEPQAVIEPQRPADPSLDLQPQWITDLIQSAMLPLERQLSEIIEPLAAVQQELDKRSKLDRKRRRATKRIAIEPTASERTSPEQAAAERAAAERIAVESAFTTQIDVQAQMAHIPEPIIVPIISPEVESQLARQSETLDNLNARLTEVKSNLGSLERVVSENFVSVINAASAPVPTPEPVNEALQKITSVAGQLKVLTAQLDDVKNNLGSLQQIVTENLASTNELRTAPEPASKESLQRLTEVANQLSHLLQDMNVRQISAEQADLNWREQLSTQKDSDVEWREQLRTHRDSDVAWREELRTHKESDLAWREQLRTQIGALRDTVAATESTLLNATASSMSAIETAAQSAIVAAAESAVLKLNEIRPLAPKATCPTSAALIANGHLQPTIAPAPKVNKPSTQPAGAQVVIAPLVSAHVEPSVARESDRAVLEVPVAIDVKSVHSPANAIVTKTVEELPEPEASDAVENEFLANQFNQYVWNPQPAQDSGIEHSAVEWSVTEATGVASSLEPVFAPKSNPIDNGCEVPPADSPVEAIEFADTSANFIEETIEEVSIVEEAASSSLPSWWTEDERTQFKDDSVASVVLSSAWKVPSNTAESSNAIEDYSNGFATNSTENSDLSSSAWDVEVAYGSSQIEQAVPVVDNELPLPLNNAAALPVIPEVKNNADSIDDASEQPDESLELSSLLERFGIAREPAANDVKDSSEYRKPITKRDSKPFGGQLPQPRVADFVQQPEPIDELTIDQTEIVHVAPPAIELPETVSALPITAPLAESGEEESIEDYMKRLMARMRGGSMEEDSRPSLSAPVATIAPTPAQSLDSMSSPKVSMPGAITERAPNSTTGPFNPEEYVPKALAPEMSRNMAAMRELANNSARSAIQVSARRRYGTAIALKLAIALIGLGVGVTLVMINGLNVNIGLIATIASFLVALIWGFDAFSTLKPLLYAAVENQEALAVPPQAEDIPQV